MNNVLPIFEGRTAETAALSLTGKVDERIGSLEYDEEIYLIVRGRVSKITHGEIKKDGAEMFARQHVVTASSIVIVDPYDGARMLDEAAMLADERFGMPQLFGHPGGPDSETGEISGIGEGEE